MMRGKRYMVNNVKLAECFRMRRRRRRRKYDIFCGFLQIRVFLSAIMLKREKKLQKPMLCFSLTWRWRALFL
jgi:hypothetical protein